MPNAPPKSVVDVERVRVRCQFTRDEGCAAVVVNPSLVRLSDADCDLLPSAVVRDEVGLWLRQGVFGQLIDKFVLCDANMPGTPVQVYVMCG